MEKNKSDHQIIQMNRNSWCIEDKDVRFFLLTGSEKALLIDSGMQVHNAKVIAESLTDLPVALLNTHSDMDHLGSVEQFPAFYMHLLEEPNYRKAGKGGEILPIHDNDVIDLGGRKLKIIHIPGHTPGSVAVLDIADRILISGDPVQVHGHIFMFGEHRNMKNYIDSLQKLYSMKNDFDEIWPSHGDIPIKPDVIGSLLDGAVKVYNGEMEGTPKEFFGNTIKVYDLGFTFLLCDN